MQCNAMQRRNSIPSIQPTRLGVDEALAAVRGGAVHLGADAAVAVAKTASAHRVLATAARPCKITNTIQSIRSNMIKDKQYNRYNRYNRYDQYNRHAQYNQWIIYKSNYNYNQITKQSLPAGWSGVTPVGPVCQPATPLTIRDWLSVVTRLQG